MMYDSCGDGIGQDWPDGEEPIDGLTGAMRRAAERDNARDAAARAKAAGYKSYGWHSSPCVDLAIEAFINGTSYLELRHAIKSVPSLEGLMLKLYNARQALGANERLPERQG